MNDLERIIIWALNKHLKIPYENLVHFNCILVIPDTSIKTHIRYLINMLFLQLGFKALFIHQESVMAAYAMALPTACVVDIGAT